MKTILFIIGAILCCLAGCKEKDWVEGTLSPVISIENLRLLYKGEELILNSDNLAGATQMNGVVISDAASGNVPEGTVVIQHLARKRIRGINVYVGEKAIDYKPGDSVSVAIQGAALKKEHGSLTIGGIGTNAIALISEQNTTHMQQVSIKQLTDNPSAYESTLIQIYAGDFIPEPTGEEFFVGDKVFSDGTAETRIHTETTADYASVQVPATASVRGIAMLYTAENSPEPEISIWPRSMEDIRAKTVILAWNLLGAVGNEATSNATITDPNLEIPTLSRGPGIAPQSAGGSYASTFPINADKEEAIEGGSYYEFSIKPKDNAIVSLSALDIILRIQTNAPRTYIWMYSVDGGITFNDIGEPYTWTTGFTDNNGIQQPQLDLSSVSDLQMLTSDAPVIFRLYAWGGTSISSNNGFRIGKSLTIAQHALAIEGTVVEESMP
ncbi:hypothetical protein FXV77_05945 [Sphingobacterium phlebotomi]|uniref:DUF5689 domain-containing protein n=1 Tax=Sphingobacterium phlebotomi TaxID=2605433 RepID=A0A5D4HB36_9SPHI|nr:DUF5689 domain-containing protein [Sphingobacterium phlebotomi]TYR37542.1 hypothetical protein FXV77_05945 [Sphingobacterium phlebotomi]